MSLGIRTNSWPQLSHHNNFLQNYGYIFIVPSITTQYISRRFHQNDKYQLSPIKNTFRKILSQNYFLKSDKIDAPLYSITVPSYAISHQVKLPYSTHSITCEFFSYSLYTTRILRRIDLDIQERLRRCNGTYRSYSVGYNARPKTTGNMPKTHIPLTKPLLSIANEIVFTKNDLFFHTSRTPNHQTKEELLSATTGFWSRLKVRFKWFSIRSLRPWNVDDWSAFVSWFVLGNILWVLAGTTTFFSLVIFSINTVIAQETLARWIGDYLTHSSGIKVVFESAVVPKWKDGVITFHNVFVSRRPGHGKAKVVKGSSVSAAAAAAAAAERQIEPENRTEDEEDTNFTQFDLTIGTINVTLSFVKWWNGRGLLRDVEVKGVRGVVDRTSVNWGNEYIDPRTYLRQHNPGDFEIDSFKMDDLLITIFQPDGFRPFSVSIFSCDLPRLRKQWLFYDFLSANHVSGAFDGSLFTLHPHQMQLVNGNYNSEIRSQDRNPWKKHNRIRIDGLKIDHLNRGVTGPFGWIHEGNIDIVADILLPADVDESIAKVMSDFYDQMEAAVTTNRFLHGNENSRHEEISVSTTPESIESIENSKVLKKTRYLIMELKLNFNEVKAAVPLFTRDLSYVNQTLIRPIVAYMNNRRTFIPINCRIIKDASDFDGSWTIYDSGLMESLSAEAYEAFAKDVVDRQAQMRRLKKVGIWSISLAVKALFMGMAGNMA